MTALSLLLLVLAAEPRFADLPVGPMLAAEKTVNVQVLAIRATTKDKEISPELKDIADQLRKQFKYTGFKVEKRETKSIEISKTLELTLLGGYKSKITPKDVDGKRIRLQIQVTKEGDEKPKMDATVSIDSGKTQLSGGWELGDGEALILGVSAR